MALDRLPNRPLPEGLAVVRIGIPNGTGLNNWIATGTEILLREGGLPEFDRPTQLGGPSIRYLLDRVGAGLDEARLDDAQTVLEVYKLPTEQILNRVKRDFKAAVAAPDLAAKIARQAATLELPGLDWGNTIGASLVVNEDTRPEVLNARNFKGISDIADKVIVRMLIASQQARSNVIQTRYDRSAKNTDPDYFPVYN